MGTCFYIRGHRDSDDPQWHIGKQSAAGRYCYACRQTFCRGGEAAIHYSDIRWYELCPKCGGKGETCCSFSWAMPRLEAEHKAAEQPTCPKCYRTLDAPHPHDLSVAADFLDQAGLFEDVAIYLRTLAGADQSELGGDKTIEDEYGRLYTAEEFFDGVLAKCPVQYTDSIGTWFS